MIVDIYTHRAGDLALHTTEWFDTQAAALLAAEKWATENGHTVSHDSNPA